MKKKILFLTICISFLFSLWGCTSKETAKDDSLVVLNYGKYVEPDLIKEFEERYHIDIKYEEYESPEEMYTKYKAKAIDYDVICTSDYMIEKLIGEDEVLPIDTSKLYNYGNIDSNILKLSQAFDPDNQYTIPYFYGTVGILYNTKLVNEPVNSWDILWDDKYKDSIIMENSVRDAFLVPLERLGYSINTTNHKQLEEALAQLKEQKKNVYAYLVDETADTMIAGDAALAVVYSGEAAMAMEYNEDLAYAVPQEGSNIWIDSWFIPKTCKHNEAALLWLDFLNEKQAAYDNFYYVWYASPNTAILDLVDEEDLEDETIFPTAQTLNRCQVYEAYDDTTNQYLNDLWKELRAY